ncbi:MAG: AAA family ATPase [Lutibacter sp.]|jgi:hypothetical protein
MARQILVYGRSGSGKTTSVRNLPKKETFLINVNKKELPFRGGEKFITLNSDNYDTIQKQIGKVDKEQLGIRYIVVDDSQYLLVNQFMKNHSTQGKGSAVFELYNNIGDSFWSLIFKNQTLRKDLTIIYLHHAEVDETGFIKPKTIGKMLDEKVDIAGMFTIVLLAVREGNNNFFITQNDGTSQAKSPMDMFKGTKIPNDLYSVCQIIEEFYNPQLL